MASMARTARYFAGASRLRLGAQITTRRCDHIHARHAHYPCGDAHTHTYASSAACSHPPRPCSCLYMGWRKHLKIPLREVCIAMSALLAHHRPLDHDHDDLSVPPLHDACCQLHLVESSPRKLSLRMAIEQSCWSHPLPCQPLRHKSCLGSSTCGRVFLPLAVTVTAIHFVARCSTFRILAVGLLSSPRTAPPNRPCRRWVTLFSPMRLAVIAYLRFCLIFGRR